MDAPEGVSLEAAAQRREVLRKLDAFSREVEEGPATIARDAFYEQAYKLLGSPQAKAAFDLTKEKPATRNRYGRKRIGQGCLLARRLVEAGVPFVEVRRGGWDMHNSLFTRIKPAAAEVDRGVAALLGDLKQRGLLKRTLVIVAGAFHGVLSVRTIIFLRVWRIPAPRSQRRLIPSLRSR